MKHIFILITVALFATSCYITETVMTPNEVVDRWIGSSEKSIVERIGLPSKTDTLSDGSTVITYDYSNSVHYTGFPSQYSDQIASYTVNHVHYYQFFVNKNGIITNARQEGMPPITKRIKKKYAKALRKDGF